MSEHSQPDSEETRQTREKPPIGPGAVLRAARESQRMTLADVAQKLRLAETLIRNIESDEYGNISSRTYARGYLVNYARLLGADEHHLLDLFEQCSVPASEAPVLFATKSHFRGLNLPSRNRWILPITLVVACIGLLIWALGDADPARISGLFGSIQSPPDMTSATAPPLTEPAVETSPTTANPEPSNPSPSRRNQATSTDPTSRLAPLTAMQPGPLLIAETPQPLDSLSLNEANKEPLPGTRQESVIPAEIPADPVAPEARQAAAESRVELRFEFSEACWVEATDSDGVRLLYDLYRAGFSKTVTARLPVKLALGNARGVKVFRNGAELTLPSQQNVFTFTIE